MVETMEQEKARQQRRNKIENVIINLLGLAIVTGFCAGEYIYLSRCKKVAKEFKAIPAAKVVRVNGFGRLFFDVNGDNVPDYNGRANGGISVDTLTTTKSGGEWAKMLSVKSMRKGENF